MIDECGPMDGRKIKCFDLNNNDMELRKGLCERRPLVLTSEKNCLNVERRFKEKNL